MPDKNKELDALLNNPPEDEEEDEEKKEDEEKEENEEGEEDEEEENEEGEDKGEGEEEGEDSKKKEKDRWHGKSREDVIKEFNEQEKKVKDLEIKLAEKEKGKAKEGEEGEEKEKEKKEEIPNDEEFQKMTPKGFATWILGEIEKRINKTYEEKSSTRDAALKEIREAQKDHPLLKTSPEYRELVLALIDTAAQKGKVIPLKEACEKVDAFAGKQKGEEGEMTEEEKARLKKAKAQVESGKGAPPTSEEEKTKEQERVEKIFGEGTPKSPLGGLGV
jgi:hypothetical protein